MPHPALIVHLAHEEPDEGLFDDPRILFDDPVVLFDGDGLPPILVPERVDQRFLRGPERAPVFYDEVDVRKDFDSATITFDSLVVAFDDVHRHQQNFASRERDGRRRRPSVVVIG